ncbi:outer membrane protein [Bradyrhizobium sp. HKCCYLS1011]|uniref:outer membrane protein n=1 Tax=Bradyrhizobium sp. HKCCYLS1011 TaxID=3420733 RepID=UPI003EBA0734
MRRVVVIGFGMISVVGLANAAFAADLPAKVYTKAPVAAPIYNWGGFYIGLNGGGASSRNCWNLTNSLGTPIPTAPSVGCHDATGAVAGGQIGYRWQITNWVLGLEAQGDWANLKGSNTSTIGTFGGFPFANQTKIDALGLFTGQVGYAWNNVLWYFKGGAAVTHAKYNGVVQTPVGAFPAGFAFDQATETRWGGAVGTGAEFGFAPGWSVAIEYDHLFMGSSSSNLYNTFGRFDRTQSIKQDVDMGTVRVNYTFGGPLVARY